MIRAITVTLTVWALVVAAALVHGVWTHRWKPNDALERAAGRLDHVPMTIGEWDGRPMDDFDLSQYSTEMIGFGQVRRYVERSSGNVVTYYLSCHLPGPISIHVPTLCFRGAGFQMAGGQKRYTVTGESLARPAEFWYGDFAANDGPIPQHLRIFWSWRGGDAWCAPDNPRWTLARHPFAYKLYVMREIRALGDPLKGDPAVRFLNLLVPELDKALYTAP
jgi:hypothetical protein